MIYFCVFSVWRRLLLWGSSDPRQVDNWLNLYDLFSSELHLLINPFWMEFFNQKKYSFSSSNWISHQFKFLIPGSFWLHGTVSRPVPASSTRMTGASVRTLVSSHWGSYQHWLRSSRKYFYSGFMTLIAPLTIRNQYWHSKMRIRNQKIQPKR